MARYCLRRCGTPAGGSFSIGLPTVVGVEVSEVVIDEMKYSETACGSDISCDRHGIGSQVGYRALDDV